MDQPKTITLDTPIQRGEQTITTITLTRPKAGALRGTSLSAVLQMDVDALSHVLPRITTPTLTKHDIAGMDPADLMQLGMEVTLFLVPKNVLSDSPTTSTTPSPISQ